MDPLLTDAGRLLLAAFLGSLVGWQREYEGRPAGVRTHALVCLGACLMTLVRFETGDPGRIAAQIVTGIGFLGAGVILRRGVTVRGLTTAATIWTVAGIGIAVGAGGRFGILAVLAALICLALLTLMKRLEERIVLSARQATLMMTVPLYKGAVSEVLEALTEAGAAVLSFASTENVETGQRTVELRIELERDVSRRDVQAALHAKLPATMVEWN